MTDTERNELVEKLMDKRRPCPDFERMQNFWRNDLIAVLKCIESLGYEIVKRWTKEEVQEGFKCIQLTGAVDPTFQLEKSAEPKDGWAQ